jgi:putative transposase
MIIPPKYSVSKAVETIKADTSRALRNRFRLLSKVYWDDGGIWSKGYFVSTVGFNDKVVRKYIEMQSKEDTGQAELEI